MQRWTTEQKAFVRANIKGKSTTELLEALNIACKSDITLAQLRSHINNHKLTSGVDARFSKGLVPHNKGKKHSPKGSEATQFKKGLTPPKYKPVGSERIDKDGNIVIKVADPSVWKTKHVWIWEQHNGPVPKGHVVIFGDRDNRNFDINNLVLVSRKQLMAVNRYGLIKNDADVTRTGVALADLLLKLSERTKEGD